MPPVPTVPTDGEAIGCIREQQQLTRADLAARVGRSLQHITAVENGYVDATGILIRLIASTLGVPESRITYNGDLPLADRARTPGARKFALAAQQARERASQRTPGRVMSGALPEEDLAASRACGRSAPSSTTRRRPPAAPPPGEGGTG